MSGCGTPQLARPMAMVCRISAAAMSIASLRPPRISFDCCTYKKGQANIALLEIVCHAMLAVRWQTAACWQRTVAFEACSCRTLSACGHLIQVSCTCVGIKHQTTLHQQLSIRSAAQATVLPVLFSQHSRRALMLLCGLHRGGDVVQDAQIGEQLVVVVALQQPQLARGHGKMQLIVGLQHCCLVGTPALRDSTSCQLPVERSYTGCLCTRFGVACQAAAAGVRTHRKLILQRCEHHYRPDALAHTPCSLALLTYLPYAASRAASWAASAAVTLCPETAT